MNFSELDIATLLIRCSVYVFIFSIGLGLQMKIIKAVKEEKAMTWDINISHSFVMIFHFTFTILIDTVTDVFPGFKMYFGTWFCYVLMFVRCYSASAITYHSLFICVYKCIIIVHNQAIRRFGMEKMKKLLFWSNLILPGFISFSYVVRPNNRFFKFMHKCGKYQYTDTSNDAINATLIGDMGNQFLFCGITNRDMNNAFDDFINIVTRVFCFLQTIVLALVVLNILEIFIYLRIFRHMQR